MPIPILWSLIGATPKHFHALKADIHVLLTDTI
jgi:hypothetical protein